MDPRIREDDEQLLSVVHWSSDDRACAVRLKLQRPILKRVHRFYRAIRQRCLFMPTENP